MQYSPATAEQKVCTRPSGSVTYFGEWTKTTPEVPMVAETSPARTMPFPTAPAGWSPAPPTTGVPGAMPRVRATAAVTSPVTSCDSCTGGRMDGSSLKRRMTSSDQSRLRWSRMSVPDMSETSPAYSPVRRKRT